MGLPLTPMAHAFAKVAQEKSAIGLTVSFQLSGEDTVRSIGDVTTRSLGSQTFRSLGNSTLRSWGSRTIRDGDACDAWEEFLSSAHCAVDSLVNASPSVA